jgi:hypothetical protein
MRHLYTVKKRLATFPSPAGMSLTKLSLGGRVWLVTFRVRKGMSLTFFTVYFLHFCLEEYCELGAQEKGLCFLNWSILYFLMFFIIYCIGCWVLVVRCLCCMSVVSVGGSFCRWLSGVGCRVSDLIDCRVLLSGVCFC